MERAYVPRNLRVRSSIQLASTRVPARAFLVTCGLVVAGGLAVVGGADLERTATSTCGAVLLALIVLELRIWGRATPEVTRIIWRHWRRRQLRLMPVVIFVPAETALPPPPRRPRWQPEQRETESMSTWEISNG